MKDRLPEEHHIFAAALPDIRAHFEDAARRGGDHGFILNAIADDLRQAEKLMESGAEPQHLQRARFNLLAAAEGVDYYPMIAHEFDAALDIALHHQRKLKEPGL